jgi:hypothetical protein
MARPKKEGMDYFPHDTDAVNDEKIEALRMLYGNDGYAFYFILLERIYRTNDFELDVSDAETRQILCRKVEVTPEKFDSMLETSLKWGCFDPEIYAERGVLTSNGIKKRADVVVQKRVRMREKYHQDKAGVSDAETSAETDAETPQSKEKKSKGKKRKDKAENLCSIEDVKTFVGSLSSPNVSESIDREILIEYIDMLRLTRGNARISANVILNLFKKWKKRDPVVVNYAMLLHIRKHDDKKEQYTSGIIRNTKPEEARKKLLYLMNGREEKPAQWAAPVEDDVIPVPVGDELARLFREERAKRQAQEGST